MFVESQSRSIIKTFSWRILATLTTAILVYLFTGRFDFAVMIGGLEMLLKMGLYFFHERAWNNIRFGKKETKPFVLWLTGLSGSGKSTLADQLTEDFKRDGFKVERLDGDIVRSIFPKTGFSKEERNSHIRRVGYLASILERNGIIVIASFISPYKESRDFVRGLSRNFIEVFVETPLEVCQKRDPKGLYKKVAAGEIKNFTGVNDPYEVPEKPEITVQTVNCSVGESVSQIKSGIKEHLP